MEGAFKAMVTVSNLGQHSYSLAKQAAREFFIPVLSTAVLIRRSYPIHSYARVARTPSRRPEWRELAIELFCRHASLALSLAIILGTVIWYNRQTEKMDDLAASNGKMAAQLDDIFRQIDTTATRHSGPGPQDVHLRGCRVLHPRLVQCVFDIDYSTKLNVFLEKGTMIVDMHGNKYYASNAVASWGLDGNVSVEPLGFFVEGPLTFGITFKNVKPETDHIALLEMLTSKKNGFSIYQFRDIPLEK